MRIQVLDEAENDLQDVREFNNRQESGVGGYFAAAHFRAAGQRHTKSTSGCFFAQTSSRHRLGLGEPGACAGREFRVPLNP